jgi:hypothetical protein
VPDPTLLTDRLIPHWISISPDQRCCWHFDAAVHPIKGKTGRTTILYGYQYFYNRNVLLIVANDSWALDDPPPNTTDPLPEIIPAIVWPKASKSPTPPNRRRPVLYLAPLQPWPTGQFGIVTQAYYRNKRNPPNRPRIRHVKVILEGTQNPFTLRIPDGYYAETAGQNRFATIKGGTALRRPDLPVGTVFNVRRDNGSWARYVIPNPTGGSRKRTTRKRHEEVGPNSGQPLTGNILGNEPIYITAGGTKIITT